MDHTNPEVSPPHSEIKRFASEGHLQQAIAGLLTRMPDTSGVQILQGTHELGKDLVFYIRGGFAEQLLCACVVKNKKITGDAGKNEGARTVFLQAQQAFDTPHTNENGIDHFVERVYVVTPFDLAPPTINSIKGLLQARSGQVIFIGRARLFDAFKRYWPDFLADEADILAQHLSHTSKRYEEDNALASLVSQYHLGSIDPNYKRIYVAQLFHRELRSYSVGQTIAESIPGEETLSREWNLSEVRKIRKGLERLIEGMRFLQKWSYVEESVADDIDETSTYLGLAIERAWRAGLNKKRARLGLKKLTFKRDDEPDIEKEEIILENASKLIHMSDWLTDQVNSALSELMSTLDLLRMVVDPINRRPASDLAYEQWHALSTQNECARMAPAAVFEAHDLQRSIILPKNVHDVWARSLMIVGAPGFGKTSFCRWHALQDVERYAAGTLNILPVYVPLHRLSEGTLDTFENAFLRTARESALLTADNKVADEKIRIRLYLDGLDEIPDQERRKEVMRLAKSGVNTNDRYQIIVTARDHVAGAWLNWMPRISLSGFDDAEIVALVSRWFEKEESDAKKFYAQLRSAPTLANLMRTPLLATLIILVFRQTGRLPESKTKLYEMFIDLLFGGWDMAKGILRESKFDRRVKMMALTTLASNLHESGRREFDDEDLRVALEEISAPAIDSRALHTELVEDGLIARAGNVSHFSHLSFQEFLTARSFQSEPQPKRVRRAVEQLLRGKNWWREVIRFYVGLSTKPKEITLWLLSEVDRVANKADTPVPTKRTNDLLAGVVEAFPEFIVDDIVDYDQSPNMDRITRKLIERISKL